MPNTPTTIRVSLAVLGAALATGCATTTSQSFADFDMPVEMEVTAVERTTNAPPQRTFEVLMERGDYQRAAGLQRKQVEADPDNHLARLGLAESLRLSRQFADADAEFQTLATIAEWRPQAQMGIARVALATEQYGAAARAFAAVTEERPEMWRAWLGLGQARDHMANWPGADEAYTGALLFSPAPAIVHNNRGVSLLARGDSSAATEAFRAALELDPTFEAAATNLDLAMATAGAELKADRSGGDAVATARRLNNFGYVAMLQGRQQDALAYFDAALSAHPSFYTKAFENRSVADNDS